MGVLDTSEGDSFSTISTLSAGVSGERKYAEGLVYGSKVYFTPYDELNFGALDVDALVFSTIPIGTSEVDGCESETGPSLCGVAGDVGAHVDQRWAPRT